MAATWRSSGHEILFQTLIDLPAERIDLPAWLAILSDRDYQACSPDHRAAGIFHEDGVFGSVNVESVGGHLLVHHYLAEDASARRIVMRSRNTRVYVMHTVPATIEVIWTLEIEPQGQRELAVPLHGRSALAGAVDVAGNTHAAAALPAPACARRNTALCGRSRSQSRGRAARRAGAGRASGET